MSVAGNDSRLPAEYKEVEWLESVDGIIYLGIGPTLVYGISCTIMYHTTSGESWVYGTGQQGSLRVGTRVVPATNEILFNRGWQRMTLQNFSAEVYHTISQFNTYVVIDGVTTSAGGSFNFAQAGNNWAVWGVGSGEQSHGFRFKNDVILYDSNLDVLADFVPCYRKDNNVMGLYDIIGNSFKQVTGSFIKSE